MYFVIIGEGTNDIACTSDGREGRFVSVLRKLYEEIALDDFGFISVTKGDLANKLPHSAGHKVEIRGLKRKAADLLYKERAARALALIAKSKKAEFGEVGAVYFSDLDYTRSEVSNSHLYYEYVVKAVEKGFANADGYKLGIPMIPRVRSESWLLCRYQDAPYQDCTSYEEMPVNDRSYSSGKTALAKYFRCSIDEIYSHIDFDDIDWERVKAPSFLFFRRRFRHVVERMNHMSFTDSESSTLLSVEGSI